MPKPNFKVRDFKRKMEIIDFLKCEFIELEEYAKKK